MESEKLIAEWALDVQRRNALYSLYRAYSDRVRSWESQLFESLLLEELPEKELESLTRKLKEVKRGKETTNS